MFTSAQQQRCVALTGRCYEIEGTPPFIPFVEIIEHDARVAPLEVLRETLGDAAPEVARLVPDLRRLFPDMPPPLELSPQQQRHYPFKNVAEFLERVSSIVLLLDDLQWADAATLLLLQHLAPLLGQLPLLALGTYRDVELDVSRPFAATLETLNRKRLAQRLNLGRLPQEGVAGMLAALGGASPPEALVVGIYRETEGNPCFVEEVYQHVEDEGVLRRDDGTWRTELDLAALDVPEGVRQVIGRRLERVNADSRKVLTFGAVVGRGFSHDLLEAVGDVTGDALLTALEEAEANYLITPMPGRAPRREFSHALIQQTLAAGLSLPWRQRLHLKVAESIEQAAGSNAEKHASDLAHHLCQAGTAADGDKTVRFLTLAGDQALEAGAFDEALRQFNDALSIQDEADQRQAADLRYKRGQALRSVGRWKEAIDEWKRTLSIYEELGDLQHTAQGGDRMGGPVRLHESEDPEGIASVSRANQAAAFFKISRSSRRRAFSRRKRRTSVCSAVVNPSSRRPASRSAWRTQLRIAWAVGSNSWPIDSGVRPARTRPISRRRNSAAYGRCVRGIVTPPYPTLGAGVHETGATPVIEGLAVLREQEAAAEFYPLACDAIGTGSVVSWGGYRLLETVGGIAAAAGMHWQRAETHYQTALSPARAPKAYRLQSKSQG